ncbi:YihY/virulence factor BrkB family protein [Terrabacter sp. C0L_2]|uniref:YihY/virulence factor BrkB family protein n=1 Tax=Terrabacter sp. C0L_2 TaxID=3108389 RepID=UPI002ED23C89|nr:YhjD/YihY/BrkB family envelope integrity protein [Terrabacter sp. C0L_2]
MAPEAAPDVDLPGEHDPADVTAGRLTRLRLRGEERAMRYAARYSELARRVPLLRVPLQMVSLYVARQRMLLASAVAFRTFLWLLPLALVAAGVLAGIGVASPSAGSGVLAATGVTGTIRGQITAALLESRGSWWVAVLVGLVLSLWTTRTLLRNLVIANAHLWDAAVPRRTQREVLRGTLVFGGAWVAIFAGAALVSHVDRLFPGGIVLSFFGQAVVSGAGWLFVSSYLPDRRTSWTDLLPGAALFGVGLSALHLVSRVMLPARIEHSAALYGSLGVAGAVLLWLLIAGQVVVGCAILNRVVLRHLDPTFDAEAAARAGHSAESGA